MLYPDLFPETTRYCYVRTDARESDLLNYDQLDPKEQSIVSQGRYPEVRIWRCPVVCAPGPARAGLYRY